MVSQMDKCLLESPEANEEESSVSPSRLMLLIEKQEYRCAISGKLLKPSDASLDHITPLVSGGTHTMDNVQIVHKEINRMKGSLSQAEFLAIIKQIYEWNT